MCGLVAILSPRRTLRLGTLADMNAVLRHRGPDDEGYFVDDGAATTMLWGPDTPAQVVESLRTSCVGSVGGDAGSREIRFGMGHRRLAIVDLSPHGHQPMQRSGLTIVFNGEIYDHIEQRRELARLGHHFTSGSDTEVLLAAYATWGTDAFRRLNGMWSCVIHDAVQRKVVLARDRYGVKPLYCWQGTDGELAVASEVKALFAHPRIAARADLAACRRWLIAGPESWREQTVFEGIRSFPAGHWAEVALDRPQVLAPTCYWPDRGFDDDRLLEPFSDAGADRYAQEYRALLDDAVRVRMRMDVRFGTALSGGLDSSQIAMLVNRELQRRGDQERQEVFSSVYPGTAGDVRANGPTAVPMAADESAFIASVATRLDVRSNRIEPRWQDVPVEHEHMIWALDLPPANTLMSSWHTYALVASRGVVVTLDGQGADEQLAGYVYYIRNLLTHAGTRRAVREAAALARTLDGVRPMILQGLAGNVLRRSLGTRALERLTQRLKRGTELVAPLGEALRRDFNTHLRTLLFYADKSSMAWSIESRMPFMDWRLVEFLQRLPHAYRIHAGWTKWLARHAMRGSLPDDVLWRRDKLGWAIPEQEWFGADGPLRAWLETRLRGHRFLRELHGTDIDTDRLGLPQKLRSLNLAVWHDLFFDEPGRPGRRLGRHRELGRR